MTLERRKFLQQFTAACGAGLARIMGFGIGSGLMSSLSGPKAAAAEAVALGAGSTTVRAQVLAVVARQAINGAPWKEICAGPMQVNNISVAEVETEILRLKRHTADGSCWCDSCREKREAVVARHEEKLNSVAHSQAAPCVCVECRSFVGTFNVQQRQALVEELKASGLYVTGQLPTRWGGP
ncbi:MAG: hypothetical protein EKK48_17040 [Candidatus Melainabacteria bacterium]|nr:MAG: hypothetical protein EKK48_17040 [Candidatus Melainabacteria bacterium]